MLNDEVEQQPSDPTSDITVGLAGVTLRSTAAFQRAQSVDNDIDRLYFEEGMTMDTNDNATVGTIKKTWLSHSLFFFHLGVIIVDSNIIST